MKTKKIIGLALAVCLVSALVVAEASDDIEAGQKPKGDGVSASRQRQEGNPRISQGRRGNSMSRQEAYSEMLEKRSASHAKVIAELQEIKKLAEEENAPRTAEAIGKMIDKKNDEFKQLMERFQGQRMERSRQLQERRAGRPERKKPVEATEGKAPEEK